MPRWTRFGEVKVSKPQQLVFLKSGKRTDSLILPPTTTRSLARLMIGEHPGLLWKCLRDMPESELPSCEIAPASRWNVRLLFPSGSSTAVEKCFTSVASIRSCVIEHKVGLYLSTRRLHGMLRKVGFE